MTNQTPEPGESAPSASHPSVDQLADLQEELLGTAEAAELRRHLAHCPDCADTLAALAELTELLAEEEPPAMPSDVALRIDAALAAALAEPAAATAPGAAAVPAAEASNTAGAPPHHPSTAPGAPPRRADRSTGPGRVGRVPRGRRRRSALLAAAVACLAVLGLGTAALVSGPGSGSQRPADTSVAAGQQDNPAAAVPTSPAGTPFGPAFTATGLPGQIRQLLPAAPSDRGTLPHVGAEQEGPSPDSVPAALPSCVQAAVTGHQGQQPLLVTHGSFRSAPVDVYVFRVSGDPTELDVFLLTPGCATATPAGTADVLLHEEVPAS